ncbi:MAG: DUF898 domain-containing protein [Variovorax sp.]|nr:MAG: DUF898 domain-containing protein [Variovorax sp.]
MPLRAETDAGAVPPNAIAPHDVRFTGAGGEYFRVWIVNVLLTIVTLGIYTPWARRRTVQYFYGHTLLADSPFEFTAPLRRMVIGFLLFVALYGAFELASNTGQDTAVSLMMVAAALLAPWLWGSAVRFRLGHTRWRGLRLQFQATWREIYSASWPVFAIAGIWIVVVFGMSALSPGAEPRVNPLPRLPTVTPAMWTLLLGGVAGAFLCLIRLEYNYKRLMVARTLIGTEAGRWKPVYRDFVRVWLAALGFFLLSAFVIASLIVLAFVVGGGLNWPQAADFRGRAGGLGILMFLLALFVVTLIALFLAITPALAYREARVFHLLWNNIGVSGIARFRCDLRAGAFVWLRIRNTLLTLLTLGFYRPFARVAEHRMKAASVVLHVRGGLDTLVGSLNRQQQDGFGDALADAVGFDIIG